MLPKWATTAFEEYRANRIADYVLKFVKQGETVLDCGCGSMLVTQAIQHRSGASVFGADVLHLNRTRLSMCVCPGERLAFASQSVDVVLLIAVLHHTRHTVQTLEECLRVARERVIVLEDVYGSRMELHLLKALDWLGNRSMSLEMNLPYEFKSEREWERLWSALGTRVKTVKHVRPIPWRPSRHRLYVIERL